VPVADFAAPPPADAYGRDGFHPGPVGTELAAERLLAALDARWPDLLTTPGSGTCRRSAAATLQHDLVAHLA
jgi:phospholipase/lecithinase/hemolysin